jgi:hypothetical protein
MMNEMTNNDLSIYTKYDEYLPTPGEQRLLEVLLNPSYYGKSITEKCQFADISRQTYYILMKKSEFTSLIKKTSIDLLKDRIGEILDASVKFAVSNARCSQDRRMLLELIGLYKEHKTLDVTAMGNTSNSCLNELSAEELRALIKTQEKLLELATE